jgi:hypothetical protein
MNPSGTGLNTAVRSTDIYLSYSARGPHPSAPHRTLVSSFPAGFNRLRRRSPRALASGVLASRASEEAPHPPSGHPLPADAGRGNRG